MPYRNLLFIAACLSLLAPGQPGWATEGCLACHDDMTQGLAPGHQVTERSCSICHSGDPVATQLPAAHTGLVAFPGNLENAAQACGTCHPAQLASVFASPMHTGTHMVKITRRVFGQPLTADANHTLQGLSDTPADSLLRKLCASCHLGREKTQHRHDVTHDQGGGCLACHLNRHPKGKHPELTVKVEDGRCFGCHSRSSRVALNYAGLAETDATSPTQTSTRLARLADGRLLEHRPADAHHQVGMSCIDCHTGNGLMGAVADADRQDQSVDIACSDCHDNQNPRIRLANWPVQHHGMLRRIPFPAATGQEFLTTANGTPLWHIEVRGDALLLHTKLAGQRRSIPPYLAADHTEQSEHARLTCNACHAQWAPQCYACHLDYSPDEPQWDHMERKITPGRWSQQRAGIRNDLPPLGVTATGDITTFVPGMIMSVHHPDFEAPLFRRLFGSLSPHTTGPARRCASCHQSPVALGLGEGELEHRAGQWLFHPAYGTLQDGLPADAWTTLEARHPGPGTYPDDRSFNGEELRRILNSGRDMHPLE